MSTNTNTPSSHASLVEQAFAKRKQAQLEARASYETIINQSLCDARRATVRMRERHNHRLGA